MSTTIKIYKSEDIPQELYPIVSDLLRDAFEERRQQNINFRCGTFTPDELQQDLKGDNYLIVAYNENDIPVGSSSLKVREKGPFHYGTLENVCVSSSAKRNGLASIIADEIKILANELKLDFLTSATACNATSSVKFHKKNGYLIYQKSFGKDYNSYSFIQPLNKLRFFKFLPLRIAVYVLATSWGS